MKLRFDDMRLGMRVLDSQFGRGRVMQVRAIDRSVLVRFDSGLELRFEPSVLQFSEEMAS